MKVNLIKKIRHSPFLALSICAESPPRIQLGANGASENVIIGTCMWNVDIDSVSNNSDFLTNFKEHLDHICSNNNSDSYVVSSCGGAKIWNAEGRSNFLSFCSPYLGVRSKSHCVTLGCHGLMVSNSPYR
jgi:hypothetical protein